MTWHSVNPGKDILSFGFLQRVDEYTLSLAEEEGGVPDIAIFSLWDDDVSEDRTWFLPPGTLEVLAPILAEMQPSPCNAPNPDTLALLYSYPPTLDPWTKRLGRRPAGGSPPPPTQS